MSLQLNTLRRPSGHTDDDQREDKWGWWEDLESFGLSKSRFLRLEDGDDVPDEAHPDFDPSPPVHAYGFYAPLN